MCVCIQPLQIKSVIAKEGLKGFIYIEAFKQTHVKQAIEGISSLRMGLFNQKVSIYSTFCCYFSDLVFYQLGEKVVCRQLMYFTIDYVHVFY